MKHATIPALVIAVLLFSSAAFAFDTIEFKDPKGDDKGPGTYVYPSDTAYTKGAFDMRGITIEDAGDDVKITVKFAKKIEDPWDSKSWEGRGWSLQMVQIYIDTDRKPKSGFEMTLPGMNVRFAETSWWEKVIMVSPQPASRISDELGKAPKMKSSVVIPRKISARGKKLVALVSKKDLGTPATGWGWQALVQSNEGYPSGGDILSRKVNEFEGQHRFGGGTDYDCDPHAIDILVEPAVGSDAEKDDQYKAMTYKFDPTKPEDISGQARVPMLYR